MNDLLKLLMISEILGPETEESNKRDKLWCISMSVFTGVVLLAGIVVFIVMPLLYEETH